MVDADRITLGSSWLSALLRFGEKVSVKEGGEMGLGLVPRWYRMSGRGPALSTLLSTLLQQRSVLFSTKTLSED